MEISLENLNVDLGAYRVKYNCQIKLNFGALSY